MGVLLVTYGAVLAAELVGDKLFYTTGVLGARYRPLPIAWGMLAAFSAKIGVAVLAGAAIARLPRALVSALTCLNLVAIAVAIARRSEQSREPVAHATAPRAAMLSFAAIFFSEWGDPGHVMAATLAARLGSPWLVWAGALAAMTSKGAVALVLGAGLRRTLQRRLSPPALCYAAAGVLIVLALLSVVEVLHTAEGPPYSQGSGLPTQN